MTAMRIVVENATYAVSHRCVLRKLFLTPLMPALHAGIGYLLAAAAEATGIVVHNLVVMPNHIHLVVTATEANLSTFRRLFFGEVGKFVKVFLSEHGFEPPENVLAAGAGHHERLIGVAAQMTALHYADVNTIKAGLVERVEQYPGLSTDLGLMNGGAVRFDRPTIYVDGRYSPDQRDVRFGAPPDLVANYGSSRKVVYRLQRLRHFKEKALAAHRKRPVLGALAVTRMHPWSEPRSPRRFRRGPKPSFLVVDDDELAERCALETTHIRERYRDARLALLAGEEAVFPYGTNKLRVEHGVTVEPVEATEGFVVNAPGPVRAKPLSRDALRTLHTRLREEAQKVTPEEDEDNLAARLERGRADEVDRRDAPNVRTEPMPNAEGDRVDGELHKLVVLRGSTATARRRRRQQQLARARSEPPDASDVEPPFD